MNQDIFDRIMGLPGLRILEPFYKKNKEVLMYLLFGGLTSVVCVVSFGIFHLTFGMDELIANVISWIFAVTFAFVTNRIWVFHASTDSVVDFVKQMVAFYGGRVLTLVIEELMILLFIKLLQWPSMSVKVAAQVVVIVLNYVISKLFVFRKKATIEKNRV